MNTSPLELIVTAGLLKDRRFSVPAAGLRLGRSSSCEIAISDPALSRNHCLFELRDNGSLWVTDLASANGTFVNGEELGSDSRQLNLGDVIQVGDSELKIVGADENVGTDKPASADGNVAVGEPEPLVPASVDLGLGGEGGDAALDDAGGQAAVKPNVMRLVLWAVAGLAVLAAAYMIIGAPPADEEVSASEPVPVEEPANSGKLVSVSFEKVQASPNGICRLELSYASDGTLAATVDDVPTANRHVEKSVKLAPSTIERLDKMLKDTALYALAPSYVGTPLREGELKSMRFKIVRTSGIFVTRVENDQEPEPLRETREQLEAFAKNELGIWGIDKSIDELKTMSAEARRNGDAKWDERDVQHGNLAQAISAYGEAVMLLETVNPKPDSYDSLIARLREAKAELDRRYREQCFRADKAVNLKDWETARAELRILCDMVPDDRDPRYAEANAKLLDVEARQKGGKK